VDTKQLNPSMGIVSLFDQHPTLAVMLTNLAELLLRGSSPLSYSEREIIAAFVSLRNNCNFCFLSHVFCAQALLEKEEPFTEFQADEFMWEMKSESYFNNCSSRIRSLLTLAQLVAIKADAPTMNVAKELAKLNGVSDEEIHHTVAIAAAFCMFNRYVDGLNPMGWPDDLSIYREMGKMLATNGYIRN
jgi:AhpD family alkylhydroperoxidase